VPSVTRRSGQQEAFGMVCVEAQAVAKPVVGFSSGGISEAILHGETGFLSEEEDWRGMAGQLFTLLQDANLRQRFGRAGRELVLREFDLERRTRVLEGIYSRVADQGTSPKGGELWADTVINSYS